MRLALIAAAALVFVAVSAGVARWLTADNAERDKVESLLRAQARGDAGGMLRELDRCAGGCAERVRVNAKRLRRPGKLQIARYDSTTSHALGADTGQTRVVWKTPTTLTVVQCVTVKRSGNPIGGIEVELLGLSGPIPRESAC
jgi:hypothetical protein